MNDITQFLTGFGGLAVFAVVFADQAGLPVPAPPVLLAAGALVAAGQLDPVLAVGMTAAATLLADSIWFYLGRKGSGRALHWLSRWSFSRNASSAQARAIVARYGLLALAVAKFLPGTVMPALAGALGMSTRRFLLFDGLAALFYGGCYITAGFLFHNQIQQVMVWFDRMGHGVIGLGVVLLAGYVAYKYALRCRERNKTFMNSAEQIQVKEGFAYIWLKSIVSRISRQALWIAGSAILILLTMGGLYTIVPLDYEPPQPKFFLCFLLLLLFWIGSVALIVSFNCWVVLILTSLARARKCPRPETVRAATAGMIPCGIPKADRKAIPPTVSSLPTMSA